MHFEPDEEHWHGADSANFMTHLAMQEIADDGSDAIWGDHVTDAEYTADDASANASTVATAMAAARGREREVVAGEQRRGGLRGAGALGGQRRQHGQADRAADLHGRVDEAGGQARVRSASHADIASVISAGVERPAPRPIRIVRGQHVDHVGAVDRQRA